MKRSALALALLALSGCTALRSPEPPGEQPPPVAERGERGRSGPTAASVQAEVEGQIARRLGAEALRGGQTAGTSIMVASFGGAFSSARPAVNVAVRAPTGWIGWKAGRAAALPRAVARELDRLLGNRAFWTEAPFWPEMDCPDAGARLMVLRHRGQLRVTRQACGINGLTGRLSEVVLGEAVPS